MISQSDSLTTWSIWPKYPQTTWCFEVLFTSVSSFHTNSAVKVTAEVINVDPQTRFTGESSPFFFFLAGKNHSAYFCFLPFCDILLTFTLKMLEETSSQMLRRSAAAVHSLANPKTAWWIWEAWKKTRLQHHFKHFGCDAALTAGWMETQSVCLLSLSPSAQFTGGETNNATGSITRETDLLRSANAL